MDRGEYKNTMTEDRAVQEQVVNHRNNNNDPSAPLSLYYEDDFALPPVEEHNFLSH